MFQFQTITLCGAPYLQIWSPNMDCVGSTKQAWHLRKNSFPIEGRTESSILNLSQSRRGNKSERRRSGGSKRQKD